MPIRYRTGDLFAVQGGVLAHACNVHGVWGGGIAAAFKQRFPKAFAAYKAHCEKHSPSELLGTCYLIEAGEYKIGCLFTNDGHTPAEIARLTRKSLLDLQKKMLNSEDVQMPLINAGIFGVPWELTADAIADLDLNIVVYKLS